MIHPDPSHPASRLAALVLPALTSLWSTPAMAAWFHGASEGPCPGGRASGIVFTVVAGVVVLGVAGMRLLLEQRRLEVARTLLEQGREPPAALLAGTAGADLRRGVVLVFAGLGLLLAGLLKGSHGVASAGLVPVFIGLGYLVSHRLAVRRDLGGGGHP